MMNNNIEVLTQQIIGYSKKQVEDHIEDIRSTHQKRVDILKDSIEKRLQEKEQLLSELIKIKKLNQIGQNSKELFEFAFKRAVKTIAFINKMTEEDVEKIIADAKNRILIHEKQAQDIEDNMEDQREEIDQLLQKVQQLFHVNEKTDKIQVKQKQENKMEEQAINKSDVSKKTNNTPNADKLLLGSDRQKPIKQAVKEAYEHLLPDKKEIADSEPEKITADGYALSNAKSYGETKAPTDLLIKLEKTLNNEIKDNNWEEWDDPTPKETAIPRLNNVVKLPGDIFNRERMIKENSLKDVFQKGGINDPGKRAKDDEKTDLMESAKDKFEDSIEKITPEESPDGSTSITQEIESIRQKYMVGKIAGADLLDQKGNLIISKNSVISLEKVKAAEREGKLVELILNMSLPGIDE